MVHQYQLTIEAPKSGEAVKLNGEINDQDWQRFQDYCQYVDDLLKVRLLQSEMPCSLNIKWERGGTTQFTTELPPWDDVMLFLYKLRPIYLQSEDTEFGKISNLLAKNLTHPIVHNLIKAQRNIYYGKRMSFKITLQLGNGPITIEEFLYTWLQAFEYHRDREKRELIEQLNTLFPLDAAKALFLNLLTEKTFAIFNIAQFLRVLLGLQKDNEIGFPPNN